MPGVMYICVHCDVVFPAGEKHSCEETHEIKRRLLASRRNTVDPQRERSTEALLTLIASLTEVLSRDWAHPPTNESREQAICGAISRALSIAI